MKKEFLISYLTSEGFSKKTIEAFQNTKREDFVPKEYKSQAYDNIPLPTSQCQSISQPYTIAFMLDLLNLKDSSKILEVGSGSGYVLSLINQISKNSKIYGLEIIQELVNSSSKVLSENKNIKIIQRDGNKGLEEESPFDRILVSASSQEIPKKLLEQLGQNGIMVCVVKNSILKITKEEYPGFSFVSLTK